MDGSYVYVHKDKKAKFLEIVKWWEDLTSLTLEQTKFEKMWFVNTADYIGTYLKKDKLEVKRKGMFITETQLGKGMEFPIVAEAVEKYFIEGVSFEDYIYNEKNILRFCSYKKLKKDYECFHNGQSQQRINRFYACKSGAYLYKRKYDEKRNRYQVDNVLKDSPVILLNKLDEKPIEERNINYPFYMLKAREIVHTIEGEKNQMSLF